MLSSHPYFKVNRRVEGHLQLFEKQKEFLVIYPDRITTGSEHFNLNDVLDMSFKYISDEKGFLYLHTNSRLYSYLTESDPHHFIRIYKEVKALF